MSRHILNSKGPVRLAALLLLGVVPCVAQLGEPGIWQLKGSAGVSFFSSTDTPVVSPLAPGQTSTYDTTLGDVRMDLDGFLKDPKLLLFNLGFDGELGSNSVDQGSYNNKLVGLTGNTVFLPQSSLPLRLFYLDSRYNTTGSFLTSTNDNSQLGAEWLLRFHRLPRVTLSFIQQRNNIRFPTSLTDVGYRQNLGHIGLEDYWRNWHWTAGLDTNNTISRSAGTLFVPSGVKTNSTVPSLNVTRSFWLDRGYFNFTGYGNFQDNTFGGVSAGKSRLLYLIPSLRLQHSKKLSSQYSYSFTQSQFGGLTGAGILPGNITFLQTPRLNTHAVLGRVDYELRKSVRVFEQVRYFHTTPFSTPREIMSSMTESISGVDFQEAWKSVQVGATYSGTLQAVGTNLHNNATTFSNNFQGRLGWGNAKRIHWVGTALVSKQNYVQQIGAFTNNRVFALEAESTRLKHFRIYGRAERMHIELLNLSGNTKQDSTNFQFQLSNKVWTAGISHGLINGLGALFPASVMQSPFITVPLPVELLIPTPLLNRTGRVTSAFATLRLRRSLELSGNWRKEHDLLAATDQNYSTFEVRALYRIGKVSVEGVLGRYLTEVLPMEGNLTGLRLNRYYIRVSRDFKIF